MRPIFFFAFLALIAAAVVPRYMGQLGGAAAVAPLGAPSAPTAAIADPVSGETANGTVRGAPVRLDMVEIGGLMLRNVTAVVLPDEALSENLLGLSFLSRLHRFEYRDGRLVLED